MQSLVNKKITVLLVGALVCAFIVGVFNLLAMRFDAGDVYPLYSSLRPDPLGTMALFESIEAIEGMAAQRNLRPLEMMPEPGQATVFYFGLSAGRLNHLGQDKVRTLSTLAMDGARVVFALRPARAKRNTGFDRFVRAVDEKTSENPTDDVKSRKSPGKKDKKKKEEKCAGENKECTTSTGWAALPLYRTFRIHLGVMNAGDVDTGGDSAPMAQGMHTGGALPLSLPWHSAAYMDEAAPMWETIYTLGSKPVAMQRTLGKGSVVVITDAYHITNEALLNSREPELLTWLIGPNSKVIFEESHLGLSEHPGVAALGRKYHLHWFALALLVLAMMFVWQNATSLVPQGSSATDEENVMSGKDYASGMVSLMRRNVTPSLLIHTCVGEWKRSFLKKRGGHESDVARVEALLKEGGKADSVELYGKIAKILNERKRKWTTIRRG